MLSARLARGRYALYSLGTNVHPHREPLVIGGKTFFPPAPVSSLSESLLKELQSALKEQLRKPDNPTPELNALLQRVAREAREKDIRPEELLIIFKQLWHSLADSVRPQTADQFERIRQTLVTVCIKAYYAE